MKKLVLSLCLLFGISYADNSSNTGEGEWKTFLGIEGGAGLYSVAPSLIFGYLNTYLLGQKALADSLGYNLALQLGWQKYYSQSSGLRLFFTLRGDYMQNYKKYKFDDTQFPLSNGYGFSLPFVMDWLFDFLVQGKNRSGMFVGVEIDIFGFYIINSPDSNQGGSGVANSFGARLGYKAQVENDVFDITLNIPIGGMYGIKFSQTSMWSAPINSTLTVGYKHLF